MDCFASLAMTAEKAPSLSIPRIRDHPARHQPVPDEQHHQRADGGGDEAGALIGTVMANRLTDEGRQKCAGDASTVVSINPAGLFWPGESMRAMMPATKPTTMTQRMPLIFRPFPMRR